MRKHLMLTLIKVKVVRDLSSAIGAKNTLELRHVFAIIRAKLIGEIMQNTKIIVNLINYPKKLIG